MKYKGIPIDLGGKDYIVPPMAFADLERFESAIDKFGSATLKARLQITLDVAEAALKRNYPDITADEIKLHIDLGNFVQLFEAIMDVSGLKRKSLEAEAAAGKSPAVPTGPDSTAT